MNVQRVPGAAACAFLAVLTSSPMLRADTTPLLPDVHKLLLQAAGDTPDMMPAADQQQALLQQALDLIHHIHVYHRQLRQATHEIETALGEVSSGDPSHHARSDILDADDLIRSIME